ncbi:hypothetical protein PLEOSDRAFT_1109307 [Pleurotus ostreatus PC15]|uniref:Uncharacterized protein n=1 Tax=Pleurotus ostreatus (strain PC15) TaxID=1137138 RepID=A0A067N2U6_PLEO1|nr:hypothetical protein PLEOSDRAFT_1109307 [Pleurotus ostreatus PC15]
MDSTFNDSLVPPLGTSFYKRYDLFKFLYISPSHFPHPLCSTIVKRKSFDIFEGRNFRGKSFASVSWRVDAHVYATESPPASSDYEGIVYIIFVHSGTFVVPDSRDYIREPTRFTVTPVDSKSVQAVAQEPQSWTKYMGNNGTTYGSKIDFSQDLPMFKNEGDQGFTFDAAYGSTISGNLKHSGRIVGHQTEFSFDEVTTWKEEFFRALSVFSTTKATGSLEFRFGMDNKSYDLVTNPGVPVVIDLFPA